MSKKRSNDNKNTIRIGREQRFGLVECRANEQSDEMVLEGYAAIFDSETFIGPPDWGWFEKINKNAFNGADMSDVPMKYNHSDDVPIIARTRNKSLELTVDDKGLKIKATLLDTQDCRDIYAKVKSGLLDKMSFAFTVKEEKFSEDDEGKEHREILAFDKIFDVAIVDLPAYDDTEIFARSRDLLESRKRDLENNEPAPEGGENKKPKTDYSLRAIVIKYS